MYRIIERRQRSFHGRFRIRICDRRYAAVLSGIVEVHLTDLPPGTLLHEMGIDMKLPTVPLKPIPHFLHIRFPFGFKIHDLDRVTLAADQIDLAFNDVIWLYQRNVHLRLLDGRPVAVLPLYIAEHLLQCRLALRTGEVGVLGFRQRHIVGGKPTVHVFLGDRLLLVPECGAVNILYRLMDERTEEHSVGTDRHELQLAVELVLQGAGLIHCDVRCERVCVLNIHGLHGLEVELLDVKCLTVHRLELIINLFKVSAGCPLVLIAGQYQQILRTGESRVV